DGLIVADALIKPDEYLAGCSDDGGGVVVGPGEAADRGQIIEERQGHELGLLTNGPPQQARSPEPRDPPQGSHDLPAIVLLIAICLVRARPASPYPCDHECLLLGTDHGPSCYPEASKPGCRWSTTPRPR